MAGGEKKTPTLCSAVIPVTCGLQSLMPQTHRPVLGEPALPTRHLNELSCNEDACGNGDGGTAGATGLSPSQQLPAIGHPPTGGITRGAKAWTCSLYLSTVCFTRITGPSCYRLIAKVREEGDRTLDATGFPWSWWPPALLCPVLGRLALVYPVGLRCSVLLKAGGHRFDEIVLVHEPKHTFLAGRGKVVTVKPSASSTDPHRRTGEWERVCKIFREETGFL